LTREGKEYDVICDEKQVQIAFGIAGVFRRRGWNIVGYEYERCKRIGQILGNKGSNNLPIYIKYYGDEEQLEGRSLTVWMSYVGFKRYGAL
jgi:hypothetical protein